MVTGLFTNSGYIGESRQVRDIDAGFSLMLCESLFSASAPNLKSVSESNRSERAGE